MIHKHFDISDLDLRMGKVIRLHRKSKGFSQLDLGKEIFLSDTSVSEIERGCRKISAESILLICDALDITPNDLFGYENENSGNRTDPFGRLAVNERQLLRDVAEAVMHYLEGSSRGNG